MSIEQLLQPRYKVIADYPENRYWPIGTIINFEKWEKDYWKNEISDCEGRHMWLTDYFDQWPHLFKKLEWWEQREVADMPEYAKDLENNLIGKVYRVLERGLCIGFKDNLVAWINCLPATIEEYQEYQLKQQAQ